MNYAIWYEATSDIFGHRADWARNTDRTVPLYATRDDAHKTMIEMRKRAASNFKNVGTMTYTVREY